MSDPQAAVAPVVLTPSERVLLLGDRFSEPGGMLSMTEVVLTSGNKVKVDLLVHNAVAAALLAAERSGAVALEPRQGKAMFGLMKTQELHVVPGPRPGASWPRGSFESYAVAQAQYQPTVSGWLSGIIAERTTSPQQVICNRIKAGMASRGVLHAEEKRTLKIFTSIEYHLPPATRAAAEQSGAAHVEEMLRGCQRERPQLWNDLIRNIRSAITFMTESSTDNT